MTREEIMNQGRPTELHCFETDREEQWYNLGLYDGQLLILGTLLLTEIYRKKMADI
ncbi:MAG: hypothetical protein MSG77_07720 [Prevotella sp.]|nr:hypothetical protein [Prevotella sp.]